MRLGDDVEGDAMMEAIGAVGFSESGSKYNEVLDKFINQLCEETIGEFPEAISGETFRQRVDQESERGGDGDLQETGGVREGAVGGVW